MACPYFYPVQARAQRGENALLPLGDSWTGTCRAVPQFPWQPEEAVLRPLCNLGYARGTCTRFPVEDGPDAVRFMVADDDGALVRISFVVERDHHPFAHGALGYRREPGALEAPDRGEIFSRQANAYVESYLRRKAEAAER